MSRFLDFTTTTFPLRGDHKPLMVGRLALMQPIRRKVTVTFLTAAPGKICMLSDSMTRDMYARDVVNYSISGNINNSTSINA